MTETRKFQAVKGFRDILPSDSALWNRVEQTARDVFVTYGFGEIVLPVLEQTELFARSVGQDTEIVSKEMYSFEDFEVSELYEFRTAIITRSGLPSGDVGGVFAKRVETFLENGRHALRTGQIPNTPENERILQEKLQDCLLKLHASNSQGEAATGIIISEIKEWIRRMRFGDLLTMRPEATASVCRAYIEHGMHTQPGDVKLYYIGPMFRRERPQKGRYRQFYQIGAEVLTPAPKDQPENFSRDAGIDADVIEMVLVFIERCGLVGHTLYINSIGCKECRPKYVEALRNALVKVKDKLGPDSHRRIETNPLRVLDSKLESEQAVIEALPRIADHLCPACREHFKMLRDMLSMRHIAYEVNWRLVRGLDYYMRTTFEITAPGLGSQNAVCGGGRYDGLVELLGGPPTKGIGFALGTDRLILALQEAGKGAAPRPEASGLDAYIAWMGSTAYPVAVRVARALRDAGFSVEMPHEEMKFKKSLSLAARLNARFAVIIGENEVAAGTCTVKRLSEGTQQTIAEKGLAAHLRT